MGGKTSKSTQTVSIPPEVLARYNAVNARAEEAAGRPFQPYSYDPKDFVAQLTPTQLAGIQNINYAAGQAQPYFDEATGQLMGAQMAATPYYAQAGQDIGYGQQMGQMYQQQALQDYYAGRAGAQPLQQAAGYNIGAAQDIGAQLAQQAYAQQAMAGAMAQPINQRAYADLATAYGSAQPLNQAAVQQYYSGLAAAQPLQQYALGTLGRAGQIGEQISGQALGTVGEGLGMARPVQFENLARADQVYGAAQPYTGRADVAYQRGLGRAEDLQQYALGTLGQGQDISQMLSGQALSTLGRGELRAEPLQQLAQGIYGQAYQAAQPFTQAALQQYYGGLGAAGPLSQAAQQNIAAAQAGVAPYQQFATELGMAAARPVSPGALTGREIQQYMSPYMSSVVGQTQALLNQQANQAQAEQLGNAIRSGAFGGDRSRIAAANLQQQQQLAQGKVLSDLLQSGYGQALGTAQQQQQLALGAEQANRAAQQAAAAQLLGVGQAGFGQGITAAQQQAALAQQLFGQQAAAGQNIAGLGQQAFGQGLATGQAQQALAQQLFGQGATTAAQQQAIAESLFGRGATAAAQQAALGAQTFGQNQAVAQGLAALGQQQFGQGMANIAAREATAQALFGQSAQAAQQQAAIAQQLFGQGATQAAQQAALAQQAFAQNQAVGQNVAQMAQQLFGQGTGTAQAQAAIGAQQFAQQMQQAQQQQALSQLLYGQGMGAAQQQAALGQQIFGQGLAGSQQLGALGQQGFAQQLAAAQARQGLGQGLYGMGAGTAQQLAALGTGAQGAALTGAQAQLAAGQAQQQTAQAGLQALYNQFLQQQAYPFQAAQFLANVAMGTGALSGSTQTAVTPGGLLSDVRMKENIREVGKTFDGQPVYSYNYKGDDKTQMGMLAQEVEQKHPEAVGLAGGMKTVDYDKATRNSARKPVTIDGEYTSSEGGPVLPHRAGEGFARGGYANGGSPGLAAPGDMAALLAAQAQMFGPFSGAGMPTGGMPGMPGYVPNAGLPVSELVTPGPMPEAPDAVGQMQKIADIGKTGQEIYQKYKDKQTEKSAANALKTDQAPNVRSNRLDVNRGPMLAADGGAIMPYSGATQALAIPTEQKEIKKLETPAMPQGRSAIDDVAAIASTAASVMAMFSDSRVKEDIKHIGHTHDGQKIYSYRYKGEPQTHIGLLAQEVEKKHPDAVGNIKGIKTVNYDMATEDAANKAVALARGKATGGAAGRAGYQTDGTVRSRGASGEWEESFIDRAKRELMEIPSDIVRYAKGDYLKPVPAAPPITTQQTPGLAAASNVPTAPTSTSQRPRRDTRTDTARTAPPANAVDAATAVAQNAVQNVTDASQNAAPVVAAAPAPVAGGLAPDAAANAAAVTPSGGVAPAKNVSAEEAVAKDKSAPVESRMNAFLKWVSKSENFIPLATGIAAATAAPTRDPFVALAQGLGAGAQAYQPVLQRQAELESTRAQTLRERIQTAKEAITEIGGVRYFLGSDGRYYTAADWRAAGRPALIGGTIAAQQAELEAQRLGAEPSTTGAIAPVSPTAVAPASPTATTPAQAPAAFTPDAAAMQRAAQENAQMSDLTSDQRALRAATNQEVITNSIASRNAAVLTGNAINESARAFMPMFKGGVLTAGAGIDQRANFFNGVNTLLRIAGFSPDEEISAALSNKEVADKFSLLLSGQRAQSLDQRAYSALESLGKTVPQGTMQKDAVARLLADLYVTNQRDIDMANYIDQYSSSQPENIVAQNASSEFIRQYGELYEKDRKMLEQLLNDVDPQTGEPIINYLFGVGQNKDLQKVRTPAAFEKRYPGVTRYLYRQ